MSEIKNGWLGIYGAEHSKHLMTLHGFKGLWRIWCRSVVSMDHNGLKWCDWKHGFCLPSLSFYKFSFSAQLHSELWSWSKCCLCVWFMAVSQGRTNRNRCTQRLVISQRTLIECQEPGHSLCGHSSCGQSDLVYEPKSTAVKSGRI